MLNLARPPQSLTEPPLSRSPLPFQERRKGEKTGGGGSLQPQGAHFSISSFLSLHLSELTLCSVWVTVCIPVSSPPLFYSTSHTRTHNSAIALAIIKMSLQSAFYSEMYNLFFINSYLFFLIHYQCLIVFISEMFTFCWEVHFIKISGKGALCCSFSLRFPRTVRFSSIRKGVWIVIQSEIS